MAKITEYTELHLDDLVIGKGQSRTGDVGKDIDELAKSIEIQGLLQPIVVCQSEQPGKWEILTGQRRFLAHKKLKRDKIVAAILDERVSEGEAKAISITENLLRRNLSGKELIDGITHLYHFYGDSVKAVVEATGISDGKVRDYVKYPRLEPELKQKVDDGLDIQVALKAQDAYDYSQEDGKPNLDQFLELAEEMKGMIGVQRDRLVEEIVNSKPIKEAIEDAKSGSKVVQVIATISMDTHKAIQKYRSEKNLKQDDAVVELIEKALTDEGLLE